jgi:hypothetical protein
MILPLSPDQNDIQTALRSFLLSALPDGDACFAGFIAGTTMTVDSVTPGSGTIDVGDSVLGLGVAPGTVVTAYGLATTGAAGTYTVSPSQILGADGDFVTMATGVEVYEGQDNRVPESPFPDQVVMTPIRSPRLTTNVDDYADGLFTGSITGTTMTITAVAPGYPRALSVGSTIFGVGVASRTVVTGLGTGTGGTGTYAVTPAQTVASTALAAGVELLTQSSEVVFQLDFHGPDSADFSKIASTLFRDAVGTSFFAALNPAISPLYADDPAQRPFTNENSQVEYRWVLEAHLQADQTVTVQMQFADVLDVVLVDVDAAYPP